MDLSGKICVVTGASSGIGRRTAADLAAEGAQICVVARREELLADLVDSLGGAGAGHSFFVADVSDRAVTERLGEHVGTTYGRCDVLINNAGFSRPGPFERAGALEDLDAVMATNFFGAAYVTKALLPLLIASAPSHIINVASMAGRLALAGSSNYCASKFALVGWSESLAPELARRGVHVGLIEPGPVPTEGFPQSEMINHGLMRFAVADVGDVSRAIRKSIAHRRLQRVVPRWYYLFQIPRIVAPPLYRFVQERVLRSRAPEYPSD